MCDNINCSKNKKAKPMNSHCEAQKVTLSNGIRIACTFIKSIHGSSAMDIWATDTNGGYIASRSISYKNSADKQIKVRKAMNELKFEIIGFEVGKLSEKGTHIKDLLKFIERRYQDLSVEKS